MKKSSNRQHNPPKIYICPNYPGYWERVHGLYSCAPNWLDFSCHRKRPADGVSSQVLFVEGFCRFDMMNMKNLREEMAGKVVGVDPQLKKQFAQQVRMLKSGETDYFIIPINTGQSPSDEYVFGQVPEGKTLFGHSVSGRSCDRHVTLIVREERALMPDVVCAWLEKLSPVLFGLAATCIIPRNQYWSKSKTKKYFEYSEE